MLPRSNSLLENSSKVYLRIENERIPMQLKEKENLVEASFILPHAKAQEILRGEIVTSNEEENEESFSYNSDKGIITVSYGKSSVLSYNYGNWLKKPYFYPIISTNGVRVTEDGLGDHIHHRSLWVTHGDVNGFDFWSEFENSGKVEAKDIKVKSSGKVFFELSSNNLWIEKSGNVELYEERILRVWRLSKDIILDLNITLSNSKEDTKFGDTKEGGILSIRVNEKIKVLNGGKIENSFGGINEDET